MAHALAPLQRVTGLLRVTTCNNRTLDDAFQWRVTFLDFAGVQEAPLISCSGASVAHVEHAATSEQASGDFTLSFRGNVTAPLASNASAAEVSLVLTNTEDARFAFHSFRDSVW